MAEPYWWRQYPSKQNKATRKTVELFQYRIRPIIERLAPGRTDEYYFLVVNILKDMKEYFPTEEELIPFLEMLDRFLNDIGGEYVALEPAIYNEILISIKDLSSKNNLESRLKFKNNSRLREFYAHKEPEEIGEQPNYMINTERGPGELRGIPIENRNRRNNTWRQQYKQEYNLTKRQLRVNPLALPNFRYTPKSLESAIEQARKNNMVAKILQNEFEAPALARPPNVVSTPNVAPPPIRAPVIPREHLRGPPGKSVLKRPPGARKRKTRRQR